MVCYVLLLLEHNTKLTDTFSWSIATSNKKAKSTNSRPTVRACNLIAQQTMSQPKISSIK